MAGWELFPHGADVGVRGWGATPAEAFEEAAQALTAVITEFEVQPLLAIEVECAAPDLELLFVEWLNAVIYEMAVRNMLFRQFLVRIDGVRLQRPSGASRSMSNGTRRPANRRAQPIRR